MLLFKDGKGGHVHPFANFHVPTAGGNSERDHLFAWLPGNIRLAIAWYRMLDYLNVSSFYALGLFLQS